MAFGGYMIPNQREVNFEMLASGEGLNIMTSNDQIQEIEEFKTKKVTSKQKLNKKSRDKKSNAPLPFGNNTQQIVSTSNPGTQLHQLQRGIEIGNNFNNQSGTGTNHMNSHHQIGNKFNTPMN